MYLIAIIDILSKLYNIPGSMKAKYFLELSLSVILPKMNWKRTILLCQPTSSIKKILKEKKR